MEENNYRVMPPDDMSRARLYEPEAHNLSDEAKRYLASVDSTNLSAVRRYLTRIIGGLGRLRVQSKVLGNSKASEFPQALAAICMLEDSTYSTLTGLARLPRPMLRTRLR